MTTTTTLDGDESIPLEQSHESFLFVRRAPVVGTATVLAVGIIYALAQWSTCRAITDSAFISLLVGATTLLLMGMRSLHSFVRTGGLRFYAFVMPTEDPERGLNEYRSLIRGLNRPVPSVASGLLYGVAIASSVFLLPAWPGAPGLQFALGGVLFVVNVATGIALYDLLVFFRHAVRMGRIVRIDIWQVDNPATNFLLTVTRRIALLASVYVSICLSSVLFSVLPIRGPVVGYAAFSASLMVLCIVLPPAFVAYRLGEAKSRALGEVDAKLQQVFRDTLERMKGTQQSLDTAEFEALLAFRKRIEAANPWPMWARSIATAVSVVVVSSVPILLDVTLRALVGG